ncbi:MAG: endonuclease domain-containing protein [Rhizobiales bacterium]|nr:endonuclease domain-containing protein [Hyphomicrobiales bacterium]
MTNSLRRFARRLRHDATKPEDQLWELLRDRRLGGYKFRRQVPVDRYVVDFVCAEARIVVEIDGRQHGPLADYDAQRSEVIRGYGFEVVRFTNDDIMKHPEPSLARLKAIMDMRVVG